MLIYKAENKTNGKMYIGQTVKSLKKRKRNHINTAKRKKNGYFHSAIRKYGPDNFDWEILHDNITDIEFLNRLEIFYIKKYNTFGKGYNLTEGGGGALGRVWSSKTLRKMSKAQKGEKSHRYGKKASDETRKRMSEASKGKKCYWFGKNHSEKTKRRMSEGKKGKNSHTATPIIIGDKYFDTRDEAGAYLSVNPATIRLRILHKTKWPEYSYA